MNICGLFVLNSCFNFKKSEMNLSSDIYTEKVIGFLPDIPPEQYLDKLIILSQIILLMSCCLRLWEFIII